MCVIQADHETRCRCTEVLPDKNAIRLCDASLANGRIPCTMTTFPIPDKSVLNPACLRCSRPGDFVLTLKQAVRERKPGGDEDEYEVRDVEEELRSRHSASVEFRNSSVSWSDTMDDTALIGALKGATDYVIVEREHPVLHDSNGFVTVEHRVASPPSEEFDDLLRDSDNHFCGRYLTSFAKLMLGRR